VDLGTTYTAAGLWRAGRAQVADLGGRTTAIPSVLFLREDNVVLVGDAAVRRGITEPERVVREFKRRFGDDVPLLLGEREVSAPELAGQLLRFVIGAVAEREGGPPAYVTLTHPATWGVHRRQLLITAAQAAGLPEVGLVPEPVAAAVHYASAERLAPGAVVAVYDLGGGTFDATVVRKTESGFAIAGAPTGDDELGGVDFDQAVMDHVAATLGVRWRTLDQDDPAVLAGLAQVREHAVQAKEALSSDVEASIPVILPGVTREVRITRGEFESAIRIRVLRTVEILGRALDAASVSTSDVHAALLVGGSSRMPLVSRLISSELGIPVAVDEHPKYAVCLGAAIAAGARLAPPAPTRPAAPVPAPGRPAGPAGPAGPATPAPGFPAPRPGSAAIPVPPPPGPPTPESPLGPAPAARDGGAPEGAELLVPDAPAPVAVDLARTGITEHLDTTIRLPDPGPSWRPTLADRDEPLTVTHVGDRRRGRRAALLAVLAAVSLIAAVTGIAVTARRGIAIPGTARSAAATGAPASSTEPAGAPAVLRPQPVTGAPGDTMRAVTAGDADRIVAVGDAAAGVPATWTATRGGPWTPMPGPGAGTAGVGSMSGVASAPGGTLYVAVGWVATRPSAGTPAPTGSARHAAVWTSPDATRWALQPSAGLGDTTHLGELYDVLARPGGGFVASGVDYGADERSGDGVLLSSSDGVTWQRTAVTGLDGLGPTTLRRLVADGGGLLAAGSRLQGSGLRPVIWRSADGAAWAEAAVLDTPGPGGATVSGFIRLPDGTLLAAGAGTALDGSAFPVLWRGAAADRMRALTSDVPAGSVEGLVAQGGTVIAVGAAPASGATGQAQRNAAAWNVGLPP
jgi:actin-like ATPase involved in cell morphogenesis